MKCLRCGYCCLNSFVVVVKDPKLGIVDNNFIVLSNERCPHLRGDKPGQYSCDIHDEPWYPETPCASHTQIEREDTNCRLGEHLLAKEEDI